MSTVKGHKATEVARELASMPIREKAYESTTLCGKSASRVRLHKEIKAPSRMRQVMLNKVHQ